VDLLIEQAGLVELKAVRALDFGKPAAKSNASSQPYEALA
jgi:hypothetical protein